jgi:hypothetical protein
MSDEERQTQRGPSRSVVFLTAGAVIALGVLAFILLRVETKPPTTRTANNSEEDSLAAVQANLANNNSLTNCHEARQQLNSHIAGHAEHRPPELSQEQTEQLRKLCGLDKDEIKEIASDTYSALDAHHLELCFLLRDTAKSLAWKAPSDKNGSHASLTQAAMAFAWVMRAVRLDERKQEIFPLDPRWANPVPPQFVLRRGWGTALERALVFLDLLRQFQEGEAGGPLGCLLFVRDNANDPPRLWACGVVVGNAPDLYLFDPRLGLALPGPGGKGIATLADARKDQAVLGQLTVESKHPYDVTAENAKSAEAQLVCSLSALSPRMRHLQDKLLAPKVHLHAAVDVAEDLKRLRAAVPAEGDRPAVGVWQEGPGVLRRFLPPEEGGVDKMQPFLLANLEGFTSRNDPLQVPLFRRTFYELELIPWYYMPPQFQNPDQFSYNIDLGRRVRLYFQTPFTRSATEPGGAGDLMARGSFDKIVPKLIEERELWVREKNRFDNVPPAELAEHVNEWVEKARSLYANQLRAKTPSEKESAAQAINAVWREEEASYVYVLLTGGIALPRKAEVTYLLGVCKQQQAELLQARLDMQSSSPDAADTESARDAWTDALGWWKIYLAENPKGPPPPAFLQRGREEWDKYLAKYPTGSVPAAVRQMRGRALAELGETDAAIASLEDLTEPMTPLQKVAALYQAKLLHKK